MGITLTTADFCTCCLPFLECPCRLIDRAFSLSRLSSASASSGFFCPSSSGAQGLPPSGPHSARYTLQPKVLWRLCCDCGPTGSSECEHFKVSAVSGTFWVIDKCLLKIHFHFRKGTTCRAVTVSHCTFKCNFNVNKKTLKANLDLPHACKTTGTNFHCGYIYQC